MANKDMTLMMRISANGSQARAELKKLNKDLEHFTGAGMGGQMARGGRTAFGIMGSGAKLAFAPLRAFSRLAVPVGAAVLGMGVAATKADADYEALQLRLEAVTGSAKRAAEIFKATEAFSASTPMRLDDLVDAQIILEGIGVKGPKALRQTADAAAGMGRSVSDMAVAVASLETEPLRRLGIELKRTGDLAEFAYRDKMNNVQKVTATGISNARETLLSIFDVKFGGTTSKLATSVSGLGSTLGDVMKRTFATIGKGYSPQIKTMFQGAIDWLNEFVDSGKAQEIGEKIGAALEAGMEHIKPLLDTFRGFVDFLKGNTDIGAQAFSVVATGMAEMFANSLVAYVGAMAGVFSGIGGMIWSAFEEQFLASPMGAPVRGKAARSEIKQLGYDQRQALFGEMQNWLNDNDPDRAAEFEKRASRHGKLTAMNDAVGWFSPEMQARIATYGRADAFSASVGKASAAIPGAARQATAANGAVMGRMNEQLAGLGFNWKDQEWHNYVNSKLPPSKPFMPPPAGSGIYENGMRWSPQTATSYAPVDQRPNNSMSVSDASGKPILIQIGRMIMQSDDADDMARQLISRAGQTSTLSPLGAH